MVETQVELNGRTEHERRYYLSWAQLDARAFAAAIRAHWGIENRLHWSSVSSSTMIWLGSEPAQDPKTWPSSDTSP